MLKPKKTKFKKFQKCYLKKNNSKAIFYLDKLNKETLRLEALQSSRLTAKQLEAILQTTNKTIKGKNVVKLKVFPDIPITKKPTGTRMGKGKGSVDHWSSYVVRGTSILEVFGITKKSIKSGLRSSLTKLPFKTSFSN